MSATQPTVAEYVAAGMKEADAVEMVKACQRADGAIEYAKRRGWKVNAGRLTARRELYLYSKGYRPVLVENALDGDYLRLSILGVWVQPTDPADVRTLDTDKHLSMGTLTAASA